MQLSLTTFGEAASLQCQQNLTLIHLDHFDLGSTSGLVYSGQTDAVSPVYSGTSITTRQIVSQDQLTIELEIPAGDTILSYDQTVAVPSSSPYTVTLNQTPAVGSSIAARVSNASNQILIPCSGTPGPGQFSVSGTTVTFNAQQQGAVVVLTYSVGIEIGNAMIFGSFQGFFVQAAPGSSSPVPASGSSQGIIYLDINDAESLDVGNILYGAQLPNGGCAVLNVTLDTANSRGAVFVTPPQSSTVPESAQLSVFRQDVTTVFPYAFGSSTQQILTTASQLTVVCHLDPTMVYDYLTVPSSSPYTGTLSQTPTSTPSATVITPGSYQPLLNVTTVDFSGQFSVSGTTITFSSAQAGLLVKVKYPSAAAFFGVALPIDATPATPLDRLLRSNLRERQFALDLTNAMSSVAQATVTSLRNRLKKSRDVDSLDANYAIRLCKNFGVNVQTDQLGNDDIWRLAKFAAQFRADNGSEAFVDFIAFIKDIDLIGLPLWADSSGWWNGTEPASSPNYALNMYYGPQGGTPITQGGTWIVTSSMDLTYDVEKFGTQDPTILTNLFEEFKPIHKVLRDIVPGIFPPPVPLYFAASQKTFFEVNTVAAGSIPYSPSGVTFSSGTQARLGSSTAFGVTSSPQWTMSFWYNALGSFAPGFGIDLTGSGGSGTDNIEVMLTQTLSSGNAYWLLGVGSTNSSSQEFDAEYQTENLTVDSNWHHVMIAQDVTFYGFGLIQFYIDGVSVGEVVTGTPIYQINSLLWDALRYVTLGNATGNFEIAEFWLQFGCYLDPSQPYTLGLFNTGVGGVGGGPAYLGRYGEAPNGTHAHVYCTCLSSGHASDFETNHGSLGGTFSVTGSALAFSSTAP